MDTPDNIQPSQPVNQPSNQPNNQSSGLKPNVAGALAYVLGFVSGIIIYLISKDKFARFHALQSIMLSLAVYIINYLISFLPGMGYRLQSLVSLLSLILFIFLLLKAYKGEKYKLPVIGDIAEKNA